MVVDGWMQEKGERREERGEERKVELGVENLRVDGSTERERRKGAEDLMG
jgi:hypothetical protein